MVVEVLKRYEKIRKLLERRLYCGLIVYCKGLGPDVVVSYVGVS